MHRVDDGVLLRGEQVCGLLEHLGVAGGWIQIKEAGTLILTPPSIPAPPDLPIFPCFKSKKRREETRTGN